MNMISLLRGVLGLVLIIGIAILFSNNRRRISWRLVFSGILIQVVFAVFILYSEKLSSWFSPLGWPKVAISWLGGAVVSLLSFTTEGSKFVFGRLAVNSGPDSLGVFFAFQVLPTIIFVATLTSVLYYLGILQAVVKGMAWFMAKVMGTSGAESLSNTANIFVGQTEAPLLIKPYIGKMTNSEILTIMIGGMATIAGGVMAAYIQMLGQALAEVQKISLAEAQLRFAVQLLAASVMAAPASLVIAKILYPETGIPETKGTVRLKVEKNASNFIEAAATGAMLLAFIAGIALINYLFVGLGDLLHVNAYLKAHFGQPLSLQLIFGVVLRYLAMGIGVPVRDAFAFGSLLGTKVVLNEFVAYIDLVGLIKQGALSPKGITMATYALCGFANFSSIAIQIGGIAPMAPHRKKDIASLGLKAVLGGSLATLMTATLAGILLG
jgi:CNT family concentrative nucleoside transporter